MNEPRVIAAGDAALVLEFDERIDVEINNRVVATANAVESARFEGVRDVVPAFRSLTVYFDPLRTDRALLARRLRESASATPLPATAAETEPAIRIPVSYGGADGPDLDDVASFSGLSPEEVVAIHCSKAYRVFMLGFVPGFAYLAPVDERIAMPRLGSPRTRVPAGSVAIAGLQTGIYPSDTPGGWRLIGRTAVKPFDPGARNPFLLKPGDHVQFYDSAQAGSDTRLTPY